MSEDRQDYGEILCEAVSTIVTKELEKLEYDVTKKCIVIDDTYKKQGKYTVIDGAVKYEAYSAITTLNIDDSVLVLVPKGDYSELKTILNKIISEDSDIAFNYISPLNNMLRFTDNILDTVNLNGKASILANDIDTPIKTLYEFAWDSDYSGYERLGLSVNVLTKLNLHNVITGSYGLKLSFINGDNAITEMDFGINDMNGNVYHFDTYTNQLKLFNISKLLNISRVRIELYQDNKFFDIEGNHIPSTIEGDPILNIQNEKMSDNILFSDIKIYLGYATDKFKGDTVILSTTGYPSYNKVDVDTEMNQGLKEIKILWIHDNGDGSYTNFTEDDVLRLGLDIRWYKHTLNYNEEEDKKIAGPSWSPYGFLNGKNSFFKYFLPNYDKTEEKIKVVCRILDSSGNWESFESEILTFSNELAIIDLLTYDAALGLSIVCLDDSEGNYFIYDTSSDIINEGLGQGFVRKFEVRYNGVPLNSENGLSDITEIEWLLPTDNIRNTMLTYSDSYWANESSTGEIIAVEDKGSVKSIKRKIISGSNGTVQFTQKYSIKNNWHSSNSFNTVECIVTAGNVEYKAALNLQFGKAGSSGSNITLILNYDNNNNAMVFSDGNMRECSVRTIMFDSSGKKITNAEGTWNWGFNHEKINEYVRIESEGSRAKLTFNENFDKIMPLDNYCILQATFHPSKDNEIISNSVTAYLPIAFRANYYSFIEGCRKVIYNSLGTPEYYSDAYILYDIDLNEISPSDITWKLRIDNGNDQDIVITWDNSIVTIDGANADTYQWFNFKTLTKNGNFYPALSVSPIYVKGYNDKVCLTAWKKNSNEIVWSLPLLIMQSQYDYATVNEWNGTIDINEENNTILSAMIGAGRKSKDNTFSGILMGNVSEKDSEISEIGLYGLSDGVVSFSLTEAGVATFGKGPNMGQGYMIFGLSDDINDTVNTITSGNGEMFMDIDYGYTSINYNNNSEKLLLGNHDKNQSSYLTLTNANNNPILSLKKDNYLIQSSNFINNNSGLLLNLNNGLLLINNNSRTLKLDSTADNAISVGNFNVDWTGGFSALSGSNYLGTVPSGNYLINMGNFKVSSDGSVYYKGTELTNYINNLINAASGS